MKGVKRFSVSLEEELLKSIDSIAKGHNFPNRSQAIRFLIRNYNVKDKWEKAGELSFLAGLFLGLGVGLYKGMPGTGAIIGIGVGFIVALIFNLLRKKK